MLQSFSIVGTGSAYGAYRRYDLSKLQISIAQSVTERLWLQLGMVDQIAGSNNGGIGAVAGIWWRR